MLNLEANREKMILLGLGFPIGVFLLVLEWNTKHTKNKSRNNRNIEDKSKDTLMINEQNFNTNKTNTRRKSIGYNNSHSK